MENFMHNLQQQRRFNFPGWQIPNWLSLGICLVIFIFGLSTPALAGQLQSSQPQQLSQTNKAIALRFAKDGWGTQPKWEQVWDELADRNMVLHFNSFPDAIVGLEANKTFSKDLFKGFPKIESKIENVVAEGDTVIYRSTLEGKQTGAFLGMPATGKKVKMNDFTMVKIKDGKIYEMWYETNLLSLMQQLGLAPESKS
jgi:predicted ester cyclase